jgi:hypothetical protein
MSDRYKSSRYKSTRTQAELSQLSDLCVVTDAEVATLLGICVWTLWKMDERGEGPEKMVFATDSLGRPTRCGRSLMSVRAWLESRKRAPSSMRRAKKA